VSRAEKLRARLTEVLRDAVARPNANPDRVLQAIVEELGITREMVEDFHHAACGNDCRAQPYDCPVCEVRDALSTLLDAAGAR
jgi:hypothetical protein